MVLADIIAAFPQPTALIGADHRIAHVNAGFAAVFAKGLIGRHFIAAMRQPAVIAAIEQVFENGAPTTAQYLGGSDGRETNYDVAVQRAGAGVLICLIDRSQADVAGKMRTDFIANVSHELRTPLTALTGFIETLAGPARDDETARAKFLGIMAQEAGRMTRLVDELMQLSRLEETEQHRPTDYVNLGDVLNAVRESLLIIAQNAEVEMLFELPDTPVEITGDAAQLQQVFTNLIENALKYGGEHGQVTATLHNIGTHKGLHGKAVMITVCDNGCGIAAHHIARLTERFYRVDSHRSREVGGTGLGLAIVKHIINRHRGRLRIQSELGVGTTVRILLPV
tara:strand:+ start:25858 stop:26874 length:1017 start_codon:yes stop_codon:yes gene_type:complete